MNLPIRFPSDAEVIAEDAARFQALSPKERVQALGEMFRVYEFLSASSPRPETLTRLAHHEEECSRTAIREFVARHG